MSDRPLVSNRWETIQGLFEAALLREEEDWRPFLASRCGDDSELAAKVQQLLIADRESSHFLVDAPFGGMLPLESADTNESLPLHQILSGRFELLAYLGEGGMGQVYEALDIELNQHIAIKAIRREIANLPGVLARFKREVYTTRKITHPNVCRTFDLECHLGPVKGLDGSLDKITFLTMELLRGETLAERVRRAGPLTAAEVYEVALQVGYALRAAHAVGVVHCDLKPSNIFLTVSRNTGRAVVTDFGIARIIQSEDRSSVFPTHNQGTSSGLVAGTPAYMAPEQFERGQCTPGSDIYSFGLVVYEALTGERLFPLSRSPQELQSRLDHAGTSGSAQQGLHWSALLTSCLHGDPTVRFTNIQEALDLLESKLGANSAGVPTAADKPAVQLQSFQSYRGEARRARAIPTSRSLWVAAAVVLVIGLAAGTVFHGKPTPEVEAKTSVASVAVLPFNNPGGEVDLKLLGDNFAANLTNDLARFSGLKVPSQALLAGLGPHPDLGVLSQRLPVDSFVNGSITRTSDGLLLQVALVDAKTGAHRWGQSYVRKDSDLASLDEEVSLEVAYLLRRDLEATGRNANAHRRTSVPAAQEAFRNGEAVLASNNSATPEAAADDFQQAVDADPEFAPAYERLANCYLLMANKYLRPEASRDLRAKAEGFALHSLELDGAPAAYTDLAKTEVFRNFDWKQAEKNFDHAVQLDPSDLLAHATFAFYVLTPQGRFAEARVQYAYAHRLVSNDLLVEFKEALGKYFARQYQSSLYQAQQLRREYPKSDGLNELIAVDYLGMNEAARAAGFLRTITPQTEDGRIARDAMLGVAFARLGQTSEARGILNKMVAEESPDFGLSFQLAALAAALGDRKIAFTYLKGALETRETSILFLGVDALMDPLRLDPRFQRLLLEVNLNNPRESGEN